MPDNVSTQSAFRYGFLIRWVQKTMIVLLSVAVVLAALWGNFFFVALSAVLLIGIFMIDWQYIGYKLRNFFGFRAEKMYATKDHPLFTEIPEALLITIMSYLTGPECEIFNTIKLGKPSLQDVAKERASRMRMHRYRYIVQMLNSKGVKIEDVDKGVEQQLDPIGLRTCISDAANKSILVSEQWVKFGVGEPFFKEKKEAQDRGDLWFNEQDQLCHAEDLRLVSTVVLDHSEYRHCHLQWYRFHKNKTKFECFYVEKTWGRSDKKNEIEPADSRYTPINEVRIYQFHTGGLLSRMREAHLSTLFFVRDHETGEVFLKKRFTCKVVYYPLYVTDVRFGDEYCIWAKDLYGDWNVYWWYIYSPQSIDATGTSDLSVIMKKRVKNVEKLEHDGCIRYRARDKTGRIFAWKENEEPELIEGINALNWGEEVKTCSNESEHSFWQHLNARPWELEGSTTAKKTPPNSGNLSTQKPSSQS